LESACSTRSSAARSIDAGSGLCAGACREARGSVGGGFAWSSARGRRDDNNDKDYLQAKKHAVAFCAATTFDALA